MSATLHTSMGDITIEFFPTEAPKTVANFIKLAQSGYYDSTKFHRVIKGFMDQGGDPLTKDDSKAAAWGTGGPGYTIPDEISPSLTNVAGTMAMANTGQPNTGGSQFFINAVDNPSLNGGYTVFGKVTAGMDVVTAINNTPTDSSDRPLTPVVLKSITLSQ
jgi:cyclophilin family peptidyl-prolyl cis-trans isomerase